MPDKKDFIAIFKVEAEDHLTNLDKGLVALEKNPNNAELINQLNREAHTLKGSSRVFGFHEIQEISHKIEDIFEKVGQKKLKFNPHIADSIFKALDAIRAILGKIIKEEKVDVDISDVCKELEECISGEAESRKGRVERKEDSGPKIKVQKSKTEKAMEPEGPRPEARGQRPETEKKQEVERQPKKVDDSRTTVTEEYIRVPLSRVDKLLNLTGEMVINKMKSSGKVAHVKRLIKLTKETQKRVSNIGERIKKEFPLGNSDVVKLLSQCNADIRKLREESLVLYDNISSEAFRLDPVVDELQNRMKEIRMLPLSSILEGFPRMVRDIASEKKKDVNLEFSGEETELDKKVLEGIKASLMHILRNSIDHGIEEPDKRAGLGKPKYGTIGISAFHEAGNVVITIKDDGKGIDLDEIKQTALKKRLIAAEELEKMTEKEIFNVVFMNGYSTSPIITDVSGRGIGLDVVRRDIESLKGQVYMDTEKDKGVKFTLVLPLTIAIIQVLLVRVKDMLFALPMVSIAESLKVKEKEISTIEGRMAIQVRGHTMPVIKLDEILALPRMSLEEAGATNYPSGTVRRETAKKESFVVIATSLEKRVGLIIDEIVGEEEVFIKSLGEHLGRVKNVSGATILGTGEVVVILDVADLIANSALSHPAIAPRKAAHKDKKKGKRILIVEDALSTRELEKSILEAQGYIVDTAVDGLDGLDKVSQTKYDLFVVDVQMPRMDGFEFCKTVKKSEEHKDIPVVIVTALEKEEDKRRGIEAGAQAYIVKVSFDQSNLLDTIERLTG